MKKLVIAANGHPRTNNDLLHLQDAIIDMGKALGLLCSESTSSLVLIGGFNFINVTLSAFDVTEAYFYYQGEVYYFAGATNYQDVTHFRISSTFAVNNPYLGHNIHNIRQLLPIYAGNDLPGDLVATFSRATEAIAKKSLGLWSDVHPAGSANFPQFYAGITSVAGHTVKYRRLAGGGYEFKGKANVGGASGSSLGGYGLITFSTGLMTTNTDQYGNVVAFLNGGNDPLPCPYIVTNAGISIRHDAGYSLLTYDVVCMSSIRFYESL